MGQQSTQRVEGLAEFIANYRFEEIPEKARRLAERAFIDTVGVTLAGATDEVATTTLSSLPVELHGQSTIIGHDKSAPLTTAVFVNATAGHAIDFDDVTWGMDGHPSVTMVATLLALAEQRDVSGRDLITAYVVGFEAQCYLAAPISPDHYENGWHATATFGTFGSAAAACRILGLSSEETEHALNMAASMPAGLKRNFGSTTKPIHAGQSARSGLTAALLASEGATADKTAIGGTKGFFDLYSRNNEVNINELSKLGDRWAMIEDGIHVKKYPCCYYTHTAIAATVDIISANNLHPDDIKTVVVASSRGAKETLNHDDPDTGLEAKFSMPYCIAYSIVNHNVDLDAFTAEKIKDPTVQDLRTRIRFDIDTNLEYDSNAASVAITTTNDETYHQSREVPPGSHTEPLSYKALRNKFLMCAEQSISDADANTAFEKLDSLRNQSNPASTLTYL